ncbi:MAG TPA: TonB-dependent receptor [Chthoniobacterales bacterium]|nr:TonB-dependent receptor [Chthoniobacterales bacterium]
MTSAQETSPSPAGVAEVERVMVTGSNIPTAEEVGPNPVDTYRPSDMEKLGVRNTTDLMTQLPQELGTSVNQNIANGGDGSVIPSLRGLLPKETLVLIDGKRAAIVGGGGNGGGGAGSAGVDINLIPFPMIDHIDILKDGASAIYGTDAVAGVVNIFLIHKFRGLEIGGSMGNTNMGSSNDARELEAWIKAGVGDDKTDIVVIADFYDRAAIYSRDRFLSGNANALAFGGFDSRSGNEPGRVDGPPSSFRLIPKLFFSANSPPPHSAPNVATSSYYVNPFAIATYPDGDYFAYNFAALTPSIPPADRQSFYGSFTRDICDKFLTVFADFKYTRSFFDAAFAATPFAPDAFKQPNGFEFSPSGISVPIQNPFNPFTVADATLIYNGVPIPMTTGVRFRAINDQIVRTVKTTFQDMLFDTGLRGEMGEFGDYFKNWNWELGFRYSQNFEENLTGGVVSRSGLREALLDTNPATAFNPFLGILGHNSRAAINRVYVTLHNSGVFELPLGYFHLDGDLFNLPAGRVSFALGLEYRGERWRDDPDSENTTFDTIGGSDFEASKVNRDVWATYQEVRIPITSPTWKFPSAYSLECDIAEREEWYSQNTSATSVLKAQHSQYNAQKPKFSVLWQPLDPKWIGALTLRASYTEAFHAATLPDLTPAGTESFAAFPDNLRDPKGLTPPGTGVPVIVDGNPNLKPEVAYEWSYGAVYSSKWIKGLTLSADFWHIDLRSIASFVDPQFIIDFENSFPGLVTRNPATGAITEVRNSSLNLTRAIVEGADYEAIYILDSAIFGHGDFGRLTLTLNGTYLSRFEFQPTPVSKRIGLSGEFVTGFSFTGSLPHNRAFASVFYDGPADSWLAGFDIGATVHYTGQYEDDNVDLTGSSKPQEPRSGPLLPSGNVAQFPEQGARKVSECVTLDLIASYTFKLPSPPAAAGVPGFTKDGGKNVKIDGNEKNVLPVSTAEYNPCGWRSWLNGMTLTLGTQNVFDSDPPFVAAASENNYDESLATIKGRFWYAQVKKRF